MRSDYIKAGEMQHLLAALTPPNRLACEVSLNTGLRISDVLNLRTHALKPRITVRELKTGKNRRVYFPAELLDRMRAMAGKIYVFEGRNDCTKPRSRHAVYKDLKRAAALFRMPKGLQLSPHSLRKIYAVDAYRRTGSIEKVQELLNHSDEAVTMLYAMADVMTERKGNKHGK